MHAEGNVFATIITVVVVGVAAVALLGALLVAFVMWRYRLPPRAVIAMGGALIYLASPVDVLPEILLGPFGLLDDAGVTAGAALFVYKIIQTRKRLVDAGVMGRDSRPPRTLRRARRSTAEHPGDR